MPQDGRTATVLVKDNLLLQSAKVYVNDNLIKEYDEKVPEKIDIPLDQKDEAQSIHVIVKDAAGMNLKLRWITFMLQQTYGSDLFTVCRRWQLQVVYHLL